MEKKMKKVLVYICFLLCAFMAPSFAGGEEVKDSANFEEILGRNWILEEFKNGSVIVSIDRTKPIGIDIYSLRFDAQRISGVGAPNRYFAPYTLGEGNYLSIGMVGNTRMGPIFENEKLWEQDYFSYLRKAYRWDLQDGKLKLYTRSETNNEVILIFI